MKDGSFYDLSSAQHLESHILLLASALAQLAKTRLTEKQRLLLFAARKTLQYHPHLSPTGLADHLARKLHLPLSTTKFNLKVLKTAGLLETHSSNQRGATICLSYGGKLLTQLLFNPNTKQL